MRNVQETARNIETVGKPSILEKTCSYKTVETVQSIYELYRIYTNYSETIQAIKTVQTTEGLYRKLYKKRSKLFKNYIENTTKLFQTVLKLF